MDNEETALDSYWRKRAQLEEILYNLIPYIEMTMDRGFYLETGFIIRDRDKLIEDYGMDYEDTIDRFLYS